MSRTEQFIETLHTYSQQFSGILDDFTKAYVLHYTNPNNQEYENDYNSKKHQLDSINSKLFVTTNDIQSAIDKLNKEIEILDKQLVSEKALNIKLMKTLKQTITNNDGSKEMIDETTEIYKIQYISNIMIVIGIVTLVMMLFYIFKKSSVPV